MSAGCEHEYHCKGITCCCADTHQNRLHRLWFHVSFLLPSWVPGSALLPGAWMRDVRLRLGRR